MITATVFDQLVAVCSAAKPGRVFTGRAIKAALQEKFGTNPGSVIPSDYCYNRWNRGIVNWRPLFIRLGTAEYEFLGADHPYNGVVLARPVGSDCVEQVIGEWVDGRVTIYPHPTIVSRGSPDCPQPELEGKVASPANEPSHHELDSAMPLSREQIERLYAEYLRVLDLEVTLFGCKPTETRHLIGRLGELFCARLIGGRLATRVNQAGFDVVAPNGRRISVKTTAQISGFVSISGKTFHMVDDLMIVQYEAGAFQVVYHGDIKIAVRAARPWEDRFELDLTRARSIGKDVSN